MSGLTNNAAERGPSEPKLLRVAGVGACVLVILFAFALGFVTDASRDFHWHVALGRWSLEHHALYRHDTLSHTFDGARMWTVSWLGDVIFASAYAVGGIVGTYVLRGLALAAMSVALIRDARRGRCSAFVAASLVAVVLTNSETRWFLRPEILSFALFAWVLDLSARVDPEGRLWRTWPLWLLTMVWANVHGSVAVGLAAIGLTLGEVGLRQALVRRWRRALESAAPIALCTGAACISGEGWRSVLSTTMLTAGCNTQLEWAPTTVTMLSSAEVLGLAAVAAVVVVAVALAPRRVSYGRVALFMVTLVLAARYRRCITLATIAGFACLVPAASLVRRELARRVRASWPEALGPASAFALFAFAAFTVDEDRTLSDLSTDVDPTAYPIAACRYAKTVPNPGHMLNSFNIGDYLTFCLDGDVKVAIDQRVCSLYPGEFYQRVTEESSSVSGVRSLSDDLDIGWIFAEHDALARAAADDPARWSLIYVDDQAVLYVRADRAESAAALREGDLSPIDPLRIGRAGPAEIRAWAESAAPLAIQRARCADCEVTELMAAEVAIGRGDREEAERALEALTSKRPARFDAARLELEKLARAELHLGAGQAP